MALRTNLSIAAPILMITVGVGWLLTVQGVVPQVDWIWTLGLAIVGVLTIVLRGIDKLSVVVGPLFVVASVLSFLRQMGTLTPSQELPILVITLGVLLLIAHLPVIPAAGSVSVQRDDVSAGPRKLRL